MDDFRFLTTNFLPGKVMVFRAEEISLQSTWRISPFSEWLTMVNFRPLRIGQRSPFGVAVSWLINGGYLPPRKLT